MTDAKSGLTKRQWGAFIMAIGALGIFYSFLILGISGEIIKL